MAPLTFFYEYSEEKNIIKLEITDLSQRGQTSAAPHFGFPLAVRAASGFTLAPFALHTQRVILLGAIGSHIFEFLLILYSIVKFLQPNYHQSTI